MYWESERPKQKKERDPNEFNYHTNRWRKASERHRRNNPLCEDCKKEGKPIPGYCTDHHHPISQGADPWDETNWRTLCKPCHDKKRNRERRK